jgi:hypothetical protein
MSRAFPRLRRREILRILAGMVSATSVACGDDEGPLGDTSIDDVGVGPELPSIPDVVDEELPPLDETAGLDDLLAETREVAEAYFEQSERDDVSQLASKWLEEVAPDSEDEEIGNALESVFRRILAEEGETPEEAAERLRGFVRRDFLVGDILDIEGWTLSKTELALASILVLGEERGERHRSELASPE